jgi:hypothetical protein
LIVLELILSQLALRLTSVTLGGFGMFCLMMSFSVPRLGAQAFLLIATASAIHYFTKA